MALAAMFAVVAWWSVPASAVQSITSAGPLTNVQIGDTLNCAVNHTGDLQGEFFDDIACGTFVAAGGNIYGPDDIPAGGSVTGAPNYVVFTPVSQTPVTGSGTPADPFKVVTVVDAGGTGLRVTETDTYVVGQESYRTDVVLTNGAGPQAVRVYRAGDCFLQDSDNGFGAMDATTGSVSCVGVSDQGGPGSRIEQWLPLTPGSTRLEARYSDVWAAIATGEPFPNTCRCDEEIDNGAGLSWGAAVAAGGSSSFSHLTSFSPAGNAPLVTTKTADVAAVDPSAADGYTITVSNPNAAEVALNSIADTLPPGFTYSGGSTTGVTTTDPSVAGQVLTWTGPFPVAAGGSATLHFGVTVTGTPGTYFNNAGGDAGSFAVAPTGDTAPIDVGGGGPTTTTTSSTTTTMITTTVTGVFPGSSTTTNAAAPPATTAPPARGPGPRPDGLLARTGSNPAPLVWMALVAVAMGATLLWMGDDSGMPKRRRWHWQRPSRPTHMP